MNKQIEKALNDAYLAGFMESGEGYNSECPYGNPNFGHPEFDKRWLVERETALQKIKDSLTKELSK